MVSPSSRCPDGQHLDEQRSWTGPPREHAKATDFFFPFLSFCVPHQAAELESLSVRFTFTATLCAEVTPSSAPVEEDKLLKLKSFCMSLTL